MKTDQIYFACVDQQHYTTFTRRGFMEQRCWNLKTYSPPNLRKSALSHELSHIFICFPSLQSDAKLIQAFL